MTSNWFFAPGVAGTSKEAVRLWVLAAAEEFGHFPVFVLPGRQLSDGAPSSQVWSQEQRGLRNNVVPEYRCLRHTCHGNTPSVHIGGRTHMCDELWVCVQ
jgi:hypothetical protein